MTNQTNPTNYEELPIQSNAVISAARGRTRSILHITVGDPNIWEPSQSDLDNITKMFKDAAPDLEVIATRSGVYPAFLDVPEDRKPGIFSRLWSRLF